MSSMSIAPLSEDTVRQLGSTLVIVSPVTLLKELLDNAIDSGATSIDVLVSPNTVGKLEVRDNGRGISPDDHDFLGRPGYTSKLRYFDELATLGGTTLGFRGIALASANAVGDVSVTTRVSTEHVASVVSLAKGGGVGRRRLVGAPIGTTVTVTGLFSNLPVRLQVALKDAPKNLVRMKELLQAYVFARPRLRLRFIVLETPSSSWSYAPTPDGSVKGVAMQIFGAEFSSQCAFKAFPSGKHQDDTGPRAPGEVASPPEELESCPVFEALLPTPKVDPRRLVKGAFFSVDSRPLSPALGTAKKLLTVFREHLRSCLSTITPRDAFIRLDIRCPPGSYDVNVEPSKNDILFNNEQMILDQFKAFLLTVYPTPEQIDSPISTPTAVTQDPGAPNDIGPGAQGQRLSQKWTVDMCPVVDASSGSDEDDDTSDRVRNNPRHEEVFLDSGDGTGNGDDVQTANEGLNPWSIAKLTGAARRAKAVSETAMRRCQERTSSQSPKSDAAHELEELQAKRTLLPSEGFSSQRMRRDSHPDQSSQSGPRRHDSKYTAHHLPALLSPQPNTPEEHRHLDFRHYHVSSSDDLIDAEAGERARPRARCRAIFGHPVQPRISSKGIAGRQRTASPAHLNLDRPPSELSPQGQRTREAASSRRVDAEEANLELAELAYVHRRGIEPVSSVSMPKRALQNANLMTGDLRARLVTERFLVGQNPQMKPKRLKTEQLPLESIPQGSQTCALVLTLKADERLANLFTDALRYDAWLADGKLRSAFKDGINTDDMGTLVTPLLVRIRQGSIAEASATPP